MILFHFLYVTPKQDYLHFIHFYSFPIFYFKTSNQGYLIPFHSILFHSFPLLKYIPFNSIPFPYYYFIPFHSLPFPSLMNSQTEPKCILTLIFFNIIISLFSTTTTTKKKKKKTLDIFVENFRRCHLSFLKYGFKCPLFFLIRLLYTTDIAFLILKINI